MLETLSSRLRSSIEKIARLSSVDRQDIEELVAEMQRALLSADVDVALVFSLSEAVRKRADEKLPSGITRREHVIRVVFEELTKILGEKNSQKIQQFKSSRELMKIFKTDLIQCAKH